MIPTARERLAAILTEIRKSIQPFSDADVWMDKALRLLESDPESSPTVDRIAVRVAALQAAARVCNDPRVTDQGVLNSAALFEAWLLREEEPR